MSRVTVGFYQLFKISSMALASGEPEGPKFERHFQIWPSQLIEIDWSNHVVKPHMKTFLGLSGNSILFFCLKKN